jgi:ABC-type multidrug transport system fused ATPase/permease subunit
VYNLHLCRSSLSGKLWSLEEEFLTIGIEFTHVLQILQSSCVPPIDNKSNTGDICAYDTRAHYSTCCIAFFPFTYIYAHLVSIPVPTMTPSICGSFLVDKRSLVAFTWTITTLLTYIAFFIVTGIVIHTHTRFKRQTHYYAQQYEYYQQQYNNNQNQNNNQNNEHGGEEHREENNNQNNAAAAEWQQYMLLAAMSSRSMPFLAAYVVTIALGLSLYGSTAIVGFTSLRGVYIAPCFSSTGSSKLQLGIFGGAIVYFANVLLVCAVVLGEVWVSKSDC